MNCDDLRSFQEPEAVGDASYNMTYSARSLFKEENCLLAIVKKATHSELHDKTLVFNANGFKNYFYSTGNFV
jgi:hypothetical protein